jgi:thioredoxin 1
MNATESPPLLMACLCARWCSTCSSYEAVFAACAAAYGVHVQPLWVDIEDEADLIGGIDVDNFPTLLLARDDTLLFLGTITPHAQTLSRLVASALAGDLKPGDTHTHTDSAAEVATLPHRLRAWAAARRGAQELS